MISLKHTLIALALGFGVTAQAHATTTNITDNAWHDFDVAADVAQSGGTDWIDYNDNSTLTFTFTLTDASYLRIVDAGFAGDTYIFFLNGTGYSTSAVGQTNYANYGTPLLPNVGTDFDAAWADSVNFSRSEILLAAGTYTLTGTLNQSVLNTDENGLVTPLNATVGAIQIAAVPEESTFAMLLAGLGLMAFARRRA